MLLRSLNIIPLAAASVLSVLAFAHTASAAEQANLGPVGPNEPILATVGDKRVIAYYEPNGDQCEVSVVVFAVSAAGGGHASTRFRVSLHPGELFHVDAVGDEQVMLTCGPNAEKLMVLNRGEFVTRSAKAGY